MECGGIKCRVEEVRSEVVNVGNVLNAVNVFANGKFNVMGTNKIKFKTNGLKEWNRKKFVRGKRRGCFERE